MIDIHKKVAVADFFFEERNYERAYAAYGEIIDLLLTRLEETRNIRKISKLAGWGLALLTGGFGLEDFIIVPAVNKALLKLLGIDLSDLLKLLLHCASHRLTTLGWSREVVESTDELVILRDFLLSYKLIAKETDQNTITQDILNLVNPFKDPSPVSGSEITLSKSMLFYDLKEMINGPGREVEVLNEQLFFYLLSTGKVNTDLYQELRRGRTYLEAAYQEARAQREPKTFFRIAGVVPKETFSGRVVKIYDGDTIDVLRNGRAVCLRLYGIDAPEKEQPFCRAARKLASELAFRKTVRVDVLGTDQYDRLVGLVYLPYGRILNYELVAAGMAWWYRKYAPNDKAFERLERNARELRLGLWARPNSKPPWEWRCK